MSDPNVAFTLRVRLYRRDYDARLIVIKAYDDLVPQVDYRGAYRLTCEVRHGGKVIFPKGQLVCTLAPGYTTDGIDARELVMALVAMAPDARSGVGDDYFADYTESQLEWVNTHWEGLDSERSDRYCDPETGAVKRER